MTTKVWLVEEEASDYDDYYHHVIGIYSSEKIAEQNLEEYIQKDKPEKMYKKYQKTSWDIDTQKNERSKWIPMKDYFGDGLSFIISEIELDKTLQ